ncbi:MAG: Ribose ABC transport system, permease protein RbsC, partial [uncultured Solirubrobacteraceae bacterium]
EHRGRHRPGHQPRGGARGAPGPARPAQRRADRARPRLHHRRPVVRVVRHGRQPAQHRRAERLPRARGVRHDARDPHGRDRPVRRVRARPRGRPERDGLRGGAPRGARPAHPGVRGDRAAAGPARRQGRARALHRHARGPARGPRPRADAHGRGRRRPDHRARVRVRLARPRRDPRPPAARLDRARRLRDRGRGPLAHALRPVAVRHRRQRVGLAAHGAERHAPEGPRLRHQRRARRAGRRPARGARVLGRAQRRRGARARGDRRRGHRRDAAHGRRRIAVGHAGRRPAARRHPEPHQPGGRPQLVLPVGGLRGLPGDRRRRADLPQPQAAAL